MNHLAALFVREYGGEDKGEVSDANADAGELMRIDDGGKRGAGVVEPGGFGEKVIVLSSENAPEGGGAAHVVGGRRSGLTGAFGENFLRAGIEHSRGMDAHREELQSLQQSRAFGVHMPDPQYDRRRLWTAVGTTALQGGRPYFHMMPGSHPWGEASIQRSTAFCTG